MGNFGFRQKLSAFLQKKSGNPDGKEPIRIKEDLLNLGDGYYLQISRNFRSMQISFYILLFFFVVIFMISNSGSVTYENLYYFVKDFHTAVDTTGSLGSMTLSYETDTEQSFAVYKGGLAVAGKQRLQLFTATGRPNSTANLGFSSPELLVSGGKLLVYDAGGTACQIFNSFTMIHSQTEPDTIRTADLSESGMYALATEDSRYASAVYVYSKSFRRINKYELNSEVISVRLNDSGDRIAILSFLSENGGFRTKLMLALPGSDRVILRYTVPYAAFPLGVSFTEQGDLLLFTDIGVFLVPESREAQELLLFESKIPTHFDFAEDGAVISLKKNRNSTENFLIVFDKSGKIVYNTSVEGIVSAVRKYEEFLFVRLEDRVVRISTMENREPQTVFCDGSGVMLVTDARRILICREGAAEYCIFD